MAWMKKKIGEEAYRGRNSERTRDDLFTEALTQFRLLSCAQEAQAA